MPKNINSVEIQGNLGRDPELKFTQAGASFCRFSVATTDRRKDKQTGEWKDGDTHWHQVVCWGTTADWCAANLHKGDCANIKGKISYSKKDDKFFTDIVGFEVIKVENERKQQQPEDDLPF